MSFSGDHFAPTSHGVNAATVTRPKRPLKKSTAPVSGNSVSCEVEFLTAVWDGLSRSEKTLPCKYFYDAAGSALFDQICELPEYYPTRCESEIMQSHASCIAAELPAPLRLVELGSGSSLKTRWLLDALPRPLTYLPIDISGEHLLATAERLRAEFDDLLVEPICADFTEPIELPTDAFDRSTVVYFPGSTIGNFEPTAASALLRQTSRLAGHAGGLLIGFDLAKDVDVLRLAYDDSQGVTAQFNLNLLRRINRELAGTFDLKNFSHQATYDVEAVRMQMHLVSDCDQVVSVGGRQFEIRRNERIHTENSHKYSVDHFVVLAGQAGWQYRHHWLDQAGYFCVMWLTADVRG